MSRKRWKALRRSNIVLCNLDIKGCIFRVVFGCFWVDRFYNSNRCPATTVKLDNLGTIEIRPAQSDVVALSRLKFFESYFVVLNAHDALVFLQS